MGNKKDITKKDISIFRVKKYPTLGTVFGGLAIVLVQVGLFALGGITVFNTRIESIFALGQGEKGYEFNNQASSTKFKFDPGKIEFTGEGAQLKEKINGETGIPNEELAEESNSEPTTQDPEPPEEEIITESGEEIEVPTEDSELDDEEVLGIETNVEPTISYPTDKPSIVTKEGVTYTNLIEITERSITSENTSITYQLSPDGTNWYYFTGEENRWSKTTQGWVSSNTIQEVNQFLDLYEDTLGTGELFLKIFLHSNGNETPVLSEVVVEKQVALIAPVVEEGLPEEPVLEEVIVGDLNFNILEVEIFNAAYFNGEKVVKGKVLLKDKNVKGNYQITEEELVNYEANVYFSDHQTATRDTLIGTTNLYLNSKGEAEFFLREVSTPGGYVTAEVILRNEELGIKNEGINSPLATPVQNATFTIDSTGDAGDAGIDGSCDDGGGDCTLRAALEESNANAVVDTLAFNIPNTDTGYRDYDDPGTPSSGDGVGGDDYWTIQPATVLPTISDAGTDIDGSTQTTNQGDTNTSGPELELYGDTAGEVDGLTFTGNTGSVDSFVINRFGSAHEGIQVDGDTFTLTNTYLGPDVKGVTAPAGNQQDGIELNTSHNSIIGNSTTDGNVISGNGTYGINAACGSLGSAQVITIQGNYIGLGTDGDTAVANGNAIRLLDQCDMTVGGDTASKRNIISGNTTYGVSLALSNDTISDVKIYNNFFGTDVTGINNRANGGSGVYTTTKYADPQNPIKVGALGKGNLFRYGTSIHVHIGFVRDNEIAYNTIGEGGDGIKTCCAEVAGGIYDIRIHHNYVGEFSPDPYFGINTGGITGTGIWVDRIKGFVDVYNNKVNNVSGNAGIYLAAIGQGSAYVRNNEVSNVGNHGIQFREASFDFISVTDNKVSFAGNKGFIINQFSKVGEILRNDISDSGTVGMWFLDQAGTLTVKENVVYDSGTWGIQSDNASNILFEDNAIYNSAKLDTSAPSEIDINGAAVTNVQFKSNIIYSTLDTWPALTLTGAGNIDPDGHFQINDAGDADTGPNDLQNWPEITTVTYLGGSQYRVEGRLDSNTADAPFTIEICEAEDRENPRGGCLDTLGFATTASTPDSTSGASNYFNWTADVTISGSDGTDGRRFAILATNANGSTSEFGVNFLADTGNPNYIFDPTAPTYPITLGTLVSGIQITDRTPLLDWEGSGDPLIDHYDVYLNHGTSNNLSKIGEIPKDRTNFQISSELPLAYDNWFWQVRGVQADGTVSGTSVIGYFEVIEDVEELETTSPKGKTVVEEMRPVFSWNKGGKEDIKYYEIYLRKKSGEGDIVSEENLLVTINDPDVTSYTPDEDLEPGEYEWKVISYYADGEVGGESDIEEFTISDSLAGLPETDAEDELVLVPEEVTEEDGGIGQVLLPATPLATSLIVMTASVGLLVTASSTFSLLSGGVFYRMGLLLGAVIPRKKKYWGVVYDLGENEIVPFAVVRLFKEKELITQTVTDVKGRYGMLVSEEGDYRLEVAADGFKPYGRDISIAGTEEVIEDIGMERLGENLSSIKKLLNYSRGKVYKGFNIFLLILMIMGFGYTVYATIQSPVLFNYVLLLIYLILGVLNLWLLVVWRVKNIGSVVDLDTNIGIEGVSVRFYDKERQLDVGITNKAGNLKMNLKKEKYEVRGTKAGYGDWVGPVKLRKGGYLQKNLGMKRGKAVKWTIDETPFN
ncbi:MAG TPA: hypothetical protein ENI23_03995 [bacterium]|nr:hypothetical protein [bacterium]